MGVYISFSNPYNPADMIAVQNDITAIQGDITIIQNDIVTVQEDIIVVQGDIVTIQGNMVTAQDDITTIQGELDASSIVLSTDIVGNAITVAQATPGAIILNNSGGAVDWTIPPAAAGLSVRVKGGSAHLITLDPEDDADIIVLIDGTALAAGNAIDLAAQKGNYVWLQAFDTTYWWIMAQVGAIADGGAD